MATLDLAKIVRFSVGLLILILDQGIKRWMTEIRPDVITKNFGGTFGIGEGFGFWFAITGWMVLSIVLIGTWRRLGHVPVLPASLLFFGALSNTLDRVTSGAVIDYIKIGPIPPFNLADLAILLGVLLFLIHLGPVRVNGAAVQSSRR